MLRHYYHGVSIFNYVWGSGDARDSLGCCVGSVYLRTTESASLLENRQYNVIWDKLVFASVTYQGLNSSILKGGLVDGLPIWIKGLEMSLDLVGVHTGQGDVDSIARSTVISQELACFFSWSGRKWWWTTYVQTAAALWYGREATEVMPAGSDVTATPAILSVMSTFLKLKYCMIAIDLVCSVDFVIWSICGDVFVVVCGDKSWCCCCCGEDKREEEGQE